MVVADNCGADVMSARIGAQADNATAKPGIINISWNNLTITVLPRQNQ